MASSEEQPSISDIATVSDAEAEINTLERLIGGFTGDDEYMEAILRNQRLRLKLLLEQTRGGLPAIESQGNRNRRGVPRGALGIANRTIYEDDNGPATFQVNGTVFVTEVDADETLPAGDPIKTVDDQNRAARATDAALSLLGFNGGISADSYEREETEEGGVTVQPGDTEPVLTVPVDSADWLAVGTVDKQFSLYQYYVDNDAIFDKKLQSPLGVYNDPFQFSTPLTAGDEIRVEVTRDADASAAADYFSKIDYIES